MTRYIPKLVSMLCAAAVLAAVAVNAETKSKLDEVLDRGKLIVGTGSTNAPWHFKDQNGTLPLSLLPRISWLRCIILFSAFFQIS